MYVKLEDLEDACRICGFSYDFLTESLKPVSREDVAKDIPARDMRALWEEKEQVFASQVWTRQDIEAVLAQRHVKDPDDGLVAEIAAQAKGVLEDCSDNWDRLDNVIFNVLKERSTR